MTIRPIRPQEASTTPFLQSHQIQQQQQQQQQQQSQSQTNGKIPLSSGLFGAGVWSFGPRKSSYHHQHHPQPRPPMASTTPAQYHNHPNQQHPQHHTNSFRWMIQMNPQRILSQVIFGLICFYAGLLVGLSRGPMSRTVACHHANNERGAGAGGGGGGGGGFGLTSALSFFGSSGKDEIIAPDPSSSGSGGGGDGDGDADFKPRFPHTMKGLFAGAARMNRNDFAKAFDTGVPLDQTRPDNKDVLVLYSHETSLSNASIIPAQQQTDLPQLKVDEALENCQTLKVVLTQPRRKNECLVIMGQWESYHIHKWMRLPENDRVKRGRGKIADLDLPLRRVARTHSEKGKMQQLPGRNLVNRFNNEIMIPYLTHLRDALRRLDPIAKMAAQNSSTVVVMVCNHGQSELLLNFACNAKARGIDIGQVVVFATDERTNELAKNVGFLTFYDETIFGRMPETAAKHYADRSFTGMMMAKVFCVHMISQLEYDFLFQDVDVVWFRDPLPWFTDPSNPHYDFDMYFQDDGAHSIRYAPYSANTGFYFVRANERTRYFFSSLLKQGEIILMSGSHQTALTSVLNEQVSLRGLRVKILSRDTVEFPGGYHYHYRRDYMRKVMNQNGGPAYVFHMSWTTSKENKSKFFQQMGVWHVQKKCIGTTVDKILEAEADLHLSKICCSSDPLVTCHYRDKPSKVPCRDSPPIDDGGASWWK